MDLSEFPQPPLPGLRRRDLFSILLIVSIDFSGLGLVLPVMPFYAERNGASAFAVGALIAVFALCQFLAGPVLGRLSDRYGRKPILLLSQIGSFLGYILLGLSKTLWLTFAARIIDGLTAGNMSIAQAYVSDNSTVSDRTRVLGTLAAAFGVGTMIGPAVGGLLAEKSIHAPIWAAAGLSCASALCTGLLLPTRKPPGTTPGRHEVHPVRAMLATFRNARTSRLTRLMACFYFVLSMYMSGQALFLAGRFTWRGHPFSLENVGIVFAFAALINILVQTLLMKRLLQRYSEEHLLTVGFFLMAVGFVGIGVCQSIAVLGCFLAMGNVGASILRPVVVSQLSRRLSSSRHGLVMGINQAIYAASAVAAPLLGGALLDRSRYSSWAFSIAAIAATGLVATLELSPLQEEDISVSKARHKTLVRGKEYCEEIIQ
jgi:MFS family permease